MTLSLDGRQAELKRICRVADMLCSGHASLRDRYARLALGLDLLILLASVWLVAVTFIDPLLNVVLTPFGLASQVWVGCLGIGVFMLTIVQLKTDWKGLSEGHKRSSDVFASIKREARYIMASNVIDDSVWQRFLSNYDNAGNVSISIPEREFLIQKKRHKVKIEISQYLDSYPSASLIWVRARFWVRDNFAGGVRGKP